MRKYVIFVGIKDESELLLSEDMQVPPPLVNLIAK